MEDRKELHNTLTCIVSRKVKEESHITHKETTHHN